MSSVVSNATPLIYLAKADQLGLVLSLFEEILIPEAGRISVRQVQPTHPVSIPLHPGEGYAVYGNRL
jgi:predicted nucleic acid-binding protein